MGIIRIKPKLCFHVIRFDIADGPADLHDLDVDPVGNLADSVLDLVGDVTRLVREELDRPGVIQSVARTMPVRQLGRAVDIARTVAVLSSHTASRHTSGQVLTLAGGMEGRTLWSADEIDEDAVRRRLEES